MSDKIHDVTSVRVDEKFLRINVDGTSYRILWKNCSPKLSRATLAERAEFVVSPSGYGIHWPLVDEDLAITPLLLQEDTELELEVA